MWSLSLARGMVASGLPLTFPNKAEASFVECVHEDAADVPPASEAWACEKGDGLVVEEVALPPKDR